MASANQFVDWEFPSGPHNEKIDQKFVTLVALNEKTETIDVYPEAVDKLFSNVRGPFCIHLCIGEDADSRSSLISKLLDFAQENDPSTKSSDDDFSQAFFKYREMVKKKCIVAWTKPIAGDTLEGKIVTHFFLDIWGPFKTDESSFILLSGIACALSSSIVHIQRDGLKEATSNWIKKVAHVAIKVQQSKELQKVLFFIQNWSDLDKFMPGEKGGRAYIKNLFDSADVSNTMRDIREIFQEICCFLLPVASTKNILPLKQHLNAFKKLVILQGPSKIINGEEIDGRKIQELLKSLESPSVYLNFEDKSFLSRVANHSLPCKNKDLQQDEEKFVMESLNGISLTTLESDSGANAKSQAEMDFIAGLDFFQNNSSNHSDKIISSSDLFSDWNFDEAKFDIKTKEPIKSETLSNSSKKMTMKEYMAQKNKSSDKTEETTISDSYSNSEQKPEEQSNHLISTSPNCISDAVNNIKPDSAEEIVENVLQKGQLQSLDYLLPLQLPEVDLSSITFVPKEFISNVEPVSNTFFENCFSSMSITTPNAVSVIPIYPKSETTSFSDTEPMDTTEAPSVGEIEAFQQFPSNIEIQKDSILALSTITVLKKMDLQSGISVDQVMIEILEFAKKEKDFTSQEIEAIKSHIISVFHFINAYQNRMDKQFAKTIFFKESNDLIAFSTDIRITLLNEHADKLGPLLEVTTEKLSQVEKFFLDLNEAIKEKEILNADFTLTLAEKLYRDKVNPQIRIETLDQLSKLHKIWSQKARDAFVHAYGSSNQDLFSIHLTNLEQKLNSIHKELEAQIQSKTDTTVAKNLVTKCLSFYTSEMDRSTIHNPAISNIGQFEQNSHSYYSDAIRKFKSESKSFSIFTQEKLEQELTSELNQACESKRIEFHQKLQNSLKSKPALYPDLSYAAATSSGALSLSNVSCGANFNKNQAIDNSSPPTTVGIHFGFETLSAVALIDGNSRTIYGPCPNIISFGEEILIGDNCKAPGSSIISLSNVLQNLNLNYQHNVRNGIYVRVEQIVGLILSLLDKLVSKALHTSNIFYAIAFPSCFNSSQRHAMNDAIQIAGIDGIMIRETCGLTAQMVEINQKPLKDYQDKFIISAIENEDESCDVTLYEIKDEFLVPIFHGGDNIPSMLSAWWNGIDLGIQPAFKRIEKKFRASQQIRVFFQCKNKNQERDMQIIKSIFNQAKIHPCSDVSVNIATGAAILSAYKKDTRFVDYWDKNYSYTSLDRILNPPYQKTFYRMVHHGQNLSGDKVIRLSQAVQENITKQQQVFEENKQRAKQECLTKLKDLEDSSYISSEQKDKRKQLISDAMRAIDSEEMSTYNIRQELEKL